MGFFVSVREIQRLYFATIEMQLAATIALGAILLAVVWIVRRGKKSLSERTGTYIAETVAFVITLTALVCVTFAITIVWNITLILGFVVDTVVVNRWTAIRSVISAAILLTALLLIRFINRSIDRLSETEAITDHQSGVAYHVVDVGIFVIATVIVLSLWNADLTSVFLGAGIASVVLGLAARETVAAVLAGFVLLFSRPFRVGDWIEVDERMGIVNDITIVNTKIRTFSDEHVLIPNDTITNNTLINYSRSDRLRIELEVGVDYGSDLEQACSVAESAVEELESVVDVPVPEAVLKRFGDSAITLELQFWIDNPSRQRYWRTRTEVIQAVKREFDRHGIDIPFPQRAHSTRGRLRLSSGDEDTSSIQPATIDDERAG